MGFNKIKRASVNNPINPLFSDPLTLIKFFRTFSKKPPTASLVSSKLLNEKLIYQEIRRDNIKTLEKITEYILSKI